MTEITMKDSDYIELLIRYIAISKKISDKVKQFGLKGEDLVINDIFGSQIYKEIVDSLVEHSPCGMDLLAKKLNQKFVENKLPDTQFDDVLALVDYIYSSPPSDADVEYIDKTVKDFIARKRADKEIFLHKNEPVVLHQRLNDIVIKLAVDDVLDKAVDIHPFAKPVFKASQELIGTGIAKVDEKATGLGLGEFALVIGYSGGGKTVLGTNIVANNAMFFKPSMFISCEENETQISQRFYAKYFDIPYTELHKGQANFKLEVAFENAKDKPDFKALQDNLCLLGLKGLTPITPNQIYELMLRKYEKTGFIPEVVVVDQLQFILPNSDNRGLQSWEIEKVAAAEMDELSHKKIGGQHFALWVLHQAKGKLKRNFTRDEIDGFKGIIHKADLVMGIGRDGINSNECDIFSLKVRHCSEFNVKLISNFGYMKFETGSGTTSSLAMEGYREETKVQNGAPMLEDELPPVPIMTNV